MILILALIYVLLLIGCNHAADTLIRRRAPAVQSTPRGAERPQPDIDDSIAYLEAIGAYAYALRKRAEHEPDRVKRTRLYSQSARLYMQASKLNNELCVRGAEALLHHPDEDPDAPDTITPPATDEPQIRLKPPYAGPRRRINWGRVARRVVDYIMCVDAD